MQKLLPMYVARCRNATRLTLMVVASTVIFTVLALAAGVVSTTDIVGGWTLGTCLAIGGVYGVAFYGAMRFNERLEWILKRPPGGLQDAIHFGVDFLSWTFWLVGPAALLVVAANLTGMPFSFGWSGWAIAGCNVGASWPLTAFISFVFSLIIAGIVINVDEANKMTLRYAGDWSRG